MHPIGSGRRVFGVVGFKNNGKTTLVVRLLGHLVARGWRVSTIKHAHHTVDIDQPGKDSFRHRQAGASEVVLATARRWALVHELADEPEPTLDELLAKMAPVDLVLVEGFKRFSQPKIEVHRRERGTPLLAREDPTILAVASDEPIPGLAVPLFDLDDIEAIAAFVTTHAVPG
ncbi:MAG: molybdopterin-guanine dinucleotide biosynthesis protein B [Geminicoccaceae bacterium]|nr:molybdopterin-guanine dinucleotide biosynthesis protein B [Geminicoccaceae bacterium]MCX8102088.1 molybdopterin-guanine dinucleotide biosynthesis protein B [Geminicoccaceae bacterium]MDW8369704.1 molybdopterin-guanine dinucleotide biosynthesis protein B [Geminicoccaceae bacterium]